MTSNLRLTNYRLFFDTVHLLKRATTDRVRLPALPFHELQSLDSVQIPIASCRVAEGILGRNQEHQRGYDCRDHCFFQFPRPHALAASRAQNSIEGSKAAYSVRAWSAESCVYTVTICLR
jgi:hypothetical protein